MGFNLIHFEAQMALGDLRSDELPPLAREALEAGFVGPSLVRMAILNPNEAWDIDRALPGMMADLGARLMEPGEAAIHLACARAKHILRSQVDPMPHVGYFFKLWCASDHSAPLYEIGNVDDFYSWGTSDLEERRAIVRRALQNFISTCGSDAATPDSERFLAWTS